MQTISVEMLFMHESNHAVQYQYGEIWKLILDNRDKILNRNMKAFVGYCKGQAVRYSLRGTRLTTFETVCQLLENLPEKGEKLSTLKLRLSSVPGVKFIAKTQPDGNIVDYMDVYGRQAPETISCTEALKIYRKPVDEAGARAKKAKDGADWKALYHAMRIADEGVELFTTGKITFPCANLDLLHSIRAGEHNLDSVLDRFDDRVAELESISDPVLPEKPDYAWMDALVEKIHRNIVFGVDMN